MLNLWGKPRNKINNHKDSEVFKEGGSNQEKESVVKSQICGENERLTKQRWVVNEKRWVKPRKKRWIYFNQCKKLRIVPKF